jgi:hypothetical protein
MHVHDACNYKMPQSGLTHCPGPLFINAQHLSAECTGDILRSPYKMPFLRCTFSDLLAHGRTRDLSDDKSRALVGWRSAIHFYCQYHYIIAACEISTHVLFVESVFFFDRFSISGIFCARHDLTPAFSLLLWFIWPDWYRVSCNFVSLCVSRNKLCACWSRRRVSARWKGLRR